MTARLEGRGKIRFGGTSFGDNDPVNVVTGGTGDFLGVGGVVRISGKGDLPPSLWAMSIHLQVREIVLVAGWQSRFTRLDGGSSVH